MAKIIISVNIKEKVIFVQSKTIFTTPFFFSFSDMVVYFVKRYIKPNTAITSTATKSVENTAFISATSDMLVGVTSSL